MSTAGNAKQFDVANTNTVINVATEFKILPVGGQRASKHSGYWLINMSVTAAEIIWFRMDGTAATAAGDDCWPLRSGERVLIPLCDTLNAISASGTPKMVVAGDMNSSLLYA